MASPFLTSKSRLSPDDPNSYSLPDLAKVSKYHLELEVDFNENVLRGNVKLDIERKKENETEDLILDSKGLNIISVKDDCGALLAYTVDLQLGSFGSRVEIFLKVNTKYVIIEYETSPEATGLHWLNPHQTSGKKYHFLASRCEAIHCRSVLPCQDTPSLKVPYSAKVTVPDEYVVLMSAKTIKVQSDSGKTTFEFDQPVPVPAYLIAIAAGKLDSHNISERSVVWAETAIMKEAVQKFEKAEEFLGRAEKLIGPYPWDKHNILVMPPYFPLDRMETPCLTLATQTLLADEKAHSWVDSLVTNVNFEHFWLNKGFAVFLERKIIGEQDGHFAAIRGWNELEEELNTPGLDDEFMKLNPELTGKDPNSLSSIPSEKGSVFLWYLSDLVGNDAFEGWLKAYIEHFQHKSICTNEFKEHLVDYFKGQQAADKLKAVDWDTWLKGKGMPPYKPTFDTTRAEACDALIKRWMEWIDSGMQQHGLFSPSDIEKFSSMQIVEFLRQLMAKKIPLEAVQELEKSYSLNKNDDAQIGFRWMRLCIQAQWKDQVDLALDYAKSQGRMKFVCPIIRDLYAWGGDVLRKAEDAYYDHKHQWMSVTASAVYKDLHLEEKWKNLRK